MIPRGGKVQYHADIDFNPGANSLILIDESDDFIFMNPGKFLKFSRQPKVIALTATVTENK